MSNPKFGDIVDTNFIYSDNQREVRKFGDSEVLVSGQPATYHPRRCSSFTLYIWRNLNH